MPLAPDTYDGWVTTLDEAERRLAADVDVRPGQRRGGDVVAGGAADPVAPPRRIWPPSGPSWPVLQWSRRRSELRLDSLAARLIAQGSVRTGAGERARVGVHATASIRLCDGVG